MGMETLDLAFGGDEGYRSVVYVGTKNDAPKYMKNYSCYIDEVSDLLDRLNVNVLSTNEVKLHFYVTKNTFKTLKGGRVNENFFAYKNIVIDLDFHSDEYSTTYKYTVLHNLVNILKELWKETDKPLWNITHYTGQGLQLWWCFDQVSSQLQWVYRFVQGRLIEEINKVLEAHKEFSQIEIDACSKSEVGYMRLFDTYNAHAETETRAFIENGRRYKLQELMDAVKEDLVFKKPTGSKKNNKGTALDYLRIQNHRRLKLISDCMKDRAAEGKAIEIKENRSLDFNFGLLIYYNAASYIYSMEDARKRTEELNTRFIHLSKKELKGLFDYIDGEYAKGTALKFSNKSIISYLSLTKEEQDKYDFHAYAYEWDWKKCKPNRTRDEKRRQAREEREMQILTLYNSGLTQEEIARTMKRTVKTVRGVLQKHNINRKEERIRQIQVMKSEKFKQKEVAEMLNVSLRTVKTYWNVEAA